ncbi:MAG: PAS domain S-box protein [Candidatus Omnitrophota bacterium]|nr:PAS domain S-box protein [Candidatus Omnitrophota bacterium]
MNSRSLTVTLAVAFLTLNATILLITTSLGIYFNFQNQRKLVATQQQLIAKEAANTVKGFVQEKFGVLEAAGSIGNLAVAPPEKQKLVLEKLLGIESAFRQIALLNAQGEELLRVSRLSNLASGQLRAQEKGELLSHTSPGKTYISSVYIDEISSEPLVIMAVPFTDVFGDFKGILMAEVNLKFMWDMVGKIKIGNNGLAYVVDRQGKLIAFRDISRVLKVENLIHLKEVKQFLNGDDELAAEISRGILGTRVLSTYRRLGMPDWAVVVELPAMEAYEIIITALKFSALNMLLSFVLAIIAGISLSKIITKPIIKLRDATREISKGNLDTKIEVQSSDEIGELAISFNQMAQDLQKTTVSVKVLEEEQKRFQDVAQSSGDWIWETDSQGRYTYVSPVVEEALGYKPQEVIGKYFYEFFHPDDKEELKKAALEIFSKKEAFKNFFNRNIRKDGQILIIETTGVPIVDENRRLLGYRGADRDITARKKAEEALKEYTKKIEQINKELDDFTYVVSHDLKEPLRSIDAFSKFLEDDYKDKIDAEGKGYIKRIRANSTRMQDLIEDLLEISRIDRQRNLIEEVEVSDLISEVKLRLEYTIKEKNAEIVTSDNLPKIFCDRVRLIEVFANLFSNAIKFNDKPNPRIEIGCSTKDDHYEFSVKDNGPGIEQEYYEKIFEIFQRLGKKEDHDGTGAGLTIVRKIVEMHKGRIRVDSKVGEYTTFYFTIPRRKEAILGKKKIGEILVEKQLLSKEEFKQALEEQKERG